MLLFLLSLIDESDQDKIMYLYTHFHDSMMRMAKKRLYMANAINRDYRAEDVVQNAFLKLTKYVKIINFSVTERELRSYVLSTVVHEAVNELKGEHYYDDIDDCVTLESDDNFVEDMMTHAQYDAVRAALERMKERYRMVLDYYFCQEYSVKQIAEILDVPEKTVYTRISRAKKILKEMLREENNV